MTKFEVELSDLAMADLHSVQFKLRSMWKSSPGLADYEVTQDDAIRIALSAFVAGSWAIDDLLPPEPMGSA